MKILFLKIKDGEMIESQLVEDFIKGSNDYEKMKKIMYAFEVSKNIPEKANRLIACDMVKITHFPSKTIYYIQMIDV